MGAALRPWANKPQAWLGASPGSAPLGSPAGGCVPLRASLVTELSTFIVQGEHISSVLFEAASAFRIPHA